MNTYRPASYLCSLWHQKGLIFYRSPKQSNFKAVFFPLCFPKIMRQINCDSKSYWLVTEEHILHCIQDTFHSNISRMSYFTRQTRSLDTTALGAELSRARRALQYDGAYDGLRFVLRQREHCITTWARPRFMLIRLSSPWLGFFNWQTTPELRWKCLNVMGTHSGTEYQTWTKSWANIDITDITVFSFIWTQTSFAPAWIWNSK